MDIEKLEKAQYLFIFDDQCLEHDQDCIEQLYIRGRKLAQGSGISSVYLSQSYFATPPLIRKQINYLVLKKINGTRDLNSILKECSIAADKKQMMKMFNYCVQSRADICNFLLIDLGAQDDKRFRKNFSEILDVNQF